MFMLLTFLVQVQDSAWENYAEKVAKAIIKDAGRDAIYNLRVLEDSTGRYILYYKRFNHTTPSGYKIFYRIPVLLKLPDESPKDLDRLIISKIEREQFTKEKLLEIATIGLGCGVVTIGALMGVIFGISR